MSIEVLQSRGQIATARRALVARRLSQMTRFPRVAGVLRRLGLRRTTPVGDMVKSWDIERSAGFLQQHVPLSAHVLDLGADASELPYALHSAGYRRLVGIDRSSTLWRMPHANGVRFVQGDFHDMPVRSSSIDAVTAISVIEHGYAPERLFGEVARVLRPGGYFIFSCDYWPEKIDTRGLTIFGVDWIIFSRADMLAMIDAARQFDLHLHGPVSLGARETPIRWSGRRYTFAWTVLQKGIGVP